MNGQPVDAARRERATSSLAACAPVVAWSWTCPCPCGGSRPIPAWRRRPAGWRCSAARSCTALEQADHDLPLASLVLPSGAAVRLERSPALSGVPRLVGEAGAARPRPADGALYRDAPFPRREEPATLTAVPYGVWDNRAAGPMKVWVRTV